MHPILFRIGNFPVYSYGVMLFFAFTAATLIARRELAKKGVEPQKVYNLAALMAVTGVIGARLFYIFGHLSAFSGDNWKAIFDINTAGMVYYGGLLLCIPVGILAVRWMKMPLGAVADAAGLVLPLAVGIARIGCFLNGCCGGKPSGLPWAVTYPETFEAIHPTQLYELILDLVAFAVLWYLKDRLTREWDVFFVSLSFYAVVRFTVEFFRYHTNPGAVIFFQALSGAIFLVCIGLLIYRHRSVPLFKKPGTVCVEGEDAPPELPAPGRDESG